MILRPYGLLIDGRLEIGLELRIEDGHILQIRPHTGVPDTYVVSPAFVNAHSHMEYRGLQGKIGQRQWWPWIRQITKLKMEEAEADVRRATLRASAENRATGVALIGEHSDRPYAGEAMAKNRLEGIIFQEVITFFESESPEEKLAAVERKAEKQRQDFDGPVVPNPHAVYSVDRGTLARFGRSNDPISIHLAESQAESEFTVTGGGPIGDFYREFGVPCEPTGVGVFQTAKALSLVRSGAQIVHGCDLSPGEIEELAASGASVAHCPRSNEALGCPRAPVREMLDAGVVVGLGMDSPASSGSIDVFQEMRSALATSEGRGAPLSAEEIWRMATVSGAESLSRKGWQIEEGSKAPLIKIHVEGAHRTEDVIEMGSPERVEWV